MIHAGVLKLSLLHRLVPLSTDCVVDLDPAGLDACSFILSQISSRVLSSTLRHTSDRCFWLANSWQHSESGRRFSDIDMFSHNRTELACQRLKPMDRASHSRSFSDAICLGRDLQLQDSLVYVGR